jgi:hypothetical protein
MTTTRSSEHRRTLARIINGASFALLLAVAAGCASVNRLREAQDAFNQAATAENALRFDARAADAVASLGAVRSGYASALLSLDKLENSKDQARLRNDGLWGTALTLKALTQWRLGQFDKAIATAALAKQNAADQIYPRDQAVVTALPGLVKTDQAFSKILLPNAPPADVEALLIGGNGAVANIQSGRDQVEKDHPVQVYLLQAQLAAYRNFQVAQDRLNNHATVPANHPARAHANAQLKELDRLLKLQKAGPAGANLINYWIELCTLDAP